MDRSRLDIRDPYPLARDKGLIVGIANENSVAWGCARACKDLGAGPAITLHLDGRLSIG